MAKDVEIYAAPGCPYCSRAKRILKRKGIACREHRLWLVGPWLLPPSGYREMALRTGGESVPQILVDGAPLGGCEELLALERSGRLDSLLGGVDDGSGPSA